jgi:carboxypeptidase C (cathepsin A)
MSNFRDYAHVSAVFVFPVPGYTESQKAPATDPLLWWSNGGPGCSGLLGFLTEHGPFRPQAAPGTGLDPFAFAWNTLYVATRTLLDPSPK